MSSENVTYAPYGHAHLKGMLLGFNSALFGHAAGHYLLGNGYRGYRPSLMRFGSPDSLSPFGEGGLNSYMYCGGDPINYTDPAGHKRMGVVLKFFNKLFKSSRNSGGGRKPGSSQVGQETLIGYHGTSGAAAKKILKHGVGRSINTFFVTDTFDNASRYAALKKKGTVLAVSAVDFPKVKDNAARGVVRSKGINELRLDKPAHPSLKFTEVSSGGQTSDFDRFLSLEDQMARDIRILNETLRQGG